MEKIDIAETWQTKLDKIYQAIPETDEPDVQLMDDALGSIFEMMTIMGDQLNVQEILIDRLNTLIVQLKIAKDLLGDDSEGDASEPSPHMYL